MVLPFLPPANLRQSDQAGFSILRLEVKYVTIPNGKRRKFRRRRDLFSLLRLNAVNY